MSSTIRITAIIICVLLVAGCISGPEEPENPGNDTTEPAVTVTPNDGLQLEFVSQSATYREGEPIFLDLNLKNTGERTANIIGKELYDANFVAQQPPQYPGKPSLRGVDEAANRNGESTTVSWRIDNPVDLPMDETKSFDASVRLLYNYRTTATSDVTFVSERNGAREGTQVVTDTSAGPLDVSVKVTSPQTVPQTEGDTTEIPIPVRIENVGDGKVANLNGDPQNVELLNADFPNSDQASINCPQRHFGLYDGYARLTCQAVVPSNVYKQDYMMRFDFAYNYFETERTRFSVQGLRGDQSQ